VTTTLFQSLVDLSGLSPIFASATIRRSLERAGVSPEHITRRDIETILPDLERSLTAFLGADAPGRIAEIRALARGET
jgi:hypothetical protein